MRPKKRPFHVRRRQNLRRFFEHVPQAVQDETARGFSAGTWPLFRFLHSTPAALSLCESEDGARIAWVLANAHVFLAPDVAMDVPRKRVDTLAFARRWMTKKRKHILGRLGFPPTAASVTALAKVPRHHLSSRLIVDLRAVLTDPATRVAAAHLPRLSAALIAFLAAPDLVARVHHDFLVELAASNTVGYFGIDHLLRDTIALGAQLDASLPLFASQAALREMHDELSVKAGKLMKLSNLVLPHFPVPLTRAENEVLVPLQTTDALVAEGQGMHHCLGTLQFHHALAAAGHFYSFAVTAPVRSTLAFVRFNGSAWSIYDFKGVANSPVPDEMYALAEGLLRRLQRTARATQQTVAA
ncbi:MAG: PcfJ domain-containing protein [Deltaproteobacteria bacterium]|nr:PcfJ domain-containing protein [Deltaproteobacteria bacterium]